MTGGISVIEIVELVLGLPLSIVGGIVAIRYGPLPEKLRWFIAGVFVAFVPMAIILVLVLLVLGIITLI